ncbi:unnamed protein product [Penicillium salamii]|uniref:Glutathione S-transferase kappa n=1 Tax=Penicillium salamii TaxID=1612424 RepID=A0A9W4IPG6_9EURO|nr:unnamed protein product [Penicillium salamii]
MAAPKITLYFDICSPFSYIAFHVLNKSPVFSGCNIEYVPISLRGLLQLCQNPPPIAVKNKFQWINRERLYWARRFNVAMSEAIPEGFPASTADLQLVLCLVAQKYPDNLILMIQRMYREYWAEGNSNALAPEGFSVILAQELGPQRAERVLALAKTPEEKSVLDENTQRAFGSGAFGLPWLDCTQPGGETEGFWGIDHLGRVVDFLHLDRSLDDSFGVLL